VREAERLVVRVGARRLALPLEQVEGVAIAPPISPVPGTPAGLLGLTNLRGSVLPVLDADPAEAGARRHLVVLASRQYGRFGLACDWVEELTDAPTEEVDVDALSRTIADAFDAEQKLPGVESPAAWIVPKPLPPD
jgi:purine-binding chemotaxis protein CheW